MLSKEDEKFMTWWKENREREKSLSRKLSMVLPIGLLVAIGIILNLGTGWYTRATMVANSQSTPMVLVIAVIIIAVFTSIFTKQHRWEMNEQHFLELQHKLEKEKSLTEMQQQEPINSQTGN